jgi:hypothetical protein
MIIKFKISLEEKPNAIKLLYIRKEYSLYVETSHRTLESIIVNDVEIFFDNDGRILYADGYCPYTKRNCINIMPPAYTSGALYLSSPEPSSVLHFQSVVINRFPDYWPIHINSSGWICIGDENDKGDIAVEFASSCVAVLQEESLVALWLHPEVT